MSKKRIWVAYLWWACLGLVGAHKFYLRRPVIGVMYIITLGGLLVAWALDFFTLPFQVRRANALSAGEPVPPRPVARAVDAIPWWVLLIGGPLLIGLAIYYTVSVQTPGVVERASTPEVKAAIEGELQVAGTEIALDAARTTVSRVLAVARDPESRASLEEALRAIDEAARENATKAHDAEAEVAQAMEELREVEQEAKESVSAVRRDGAQRVAEAEEDVAAAANASAELQQVARRKLADAKHEAEISLLRVEEDGQRRLATARRQLEIAESKAARERQAAVSQTLAQAQRHADRAKRLAKKQGLELPPEPAVPADPGAAQAEAAAGETVREKKRGKLKAGIELSFDDEGGDAKETTIRIGGDPPTIVTMVTPAPPKPPVSPKAVTSAHPPAPPLPPELRQELRSTLKHDVYRVTIGAFAIILTALTFVVLIVAKMVIAVNRSLRTRAVVSEKRAEQNMISRQLLEAKLAAMQAQIEPHFLFNTLASVLALIETNPPAAAKMQSHLIKYLRAAMPKMRESSTTLGQEGELCEAYLNILKMRMEDRLDFSVEIPDGLKKCVLPPMMLLTLVENSIKHGLEPKPEGGKVTISAERRADKLRVTVADTGLGFGLPSANPGSGVGLSNTRERLAALYGTNAALIIEENAAATATAESDAGAETPGARVTIELPFQL